MSSGGTGGGMGGLTDLGSAARRWHVMLTLGWQEVATRYHRSRIGPFWLTINRGVLILALSVVFGTLFGLDYREFIPYLAIGLILWGFISASITDGCTAFIRASGTILQVRMPLSIHVGSVLYKNLLVTAHDILIIPVVFVVLLRPVGLEALLAIPGFLLLTLNLGWMMLALAVICARFRDVVEIVTNILQVMFYLTPIIWTVELLAQRVEQSIVDLNPLYHLITIVRGPLMSTPTVAINWIVPAVMAMVGWAIAIYLFGRYRQRIPYWL